MTDLPLPPKSGLGYKRSPSVNVVVDMFEAKSRSASASNIAESSRRPSMIPRSTTNPRLNSPRPSLSQRGSTSQSSASTSRRPSVSSMEAGPSRSGSPRNIHLKSGIPRPSPSKGKEVEGLRSGRTSVDSGSSEMSLPLGLGIDERRFDRRSSETAASPRRPRPITTTRRPSAPITRDMNGPRLRPKITPNTQTQSPSSPRAPLSPRQAPPISTLRSPKQAAAPILSVSQATPERASRVSNASSTSNATGLGSRRTSYRLSASMDSFGSSASKSRESIEDSKPILIPERTSSVSTSPQKSPGPLISPRTSSKEAFQDESRASDIVLGEVVKPARPRRRPSELTIEGVNSIPKPSPPIPAKSPLRTLSRHSSISSRISRAVSRGSNYTPDLELTPQNQYFDLLDNQKLASPQELDEVSEKRIRRQSRMDGLWGKQNRIKPEDELKKQLQDLAVETTDKIQLPETLARPIRSPSVPMLNGLGTPPKAAKLLGIEKAPLLPSPMTRSPTAPVISPRVIPSSATSRRTHLIREIASTERAYATDLALIRDAYLSRYRTDPRNPDKIDWPAYSSDVSQYTHTAATSVSSFKTSSARSSMGPPVGKPLSPSDVRAIFLNIDQLVAGAEDLALAFEGAMGVEESGPGSVSREGEGGTDRLGEVFTALIPRLRPIYLYYCSRQQPASKRLVECLGDPSTAAHLNDCWRQIKSQTHAWNLDSMLIKPVQRITKYPLLFEDLLSCTTPVHPDYFNIRAAAELARTIAMEIDEAKRRKDVVANAISRKPRQSTLPSPVKEGKKGLKMFRKDKLPTPVPVVNMASLTNDTPPPEITRTSMDLLRDLVQRVDEADQVVRRVGKEVIIWTASAKEILIAEDQLLNTWARVINVDSEAQKVNELRRVLGGIIASAWAVLNDEVKERIMPIFSQLLDSTVNPRKVILKHESKFQDYTRYINAVKAKRTPDRSLLLSARDFYALHTQLVEELPIFLEGYSKILDLALVAFADAQSRYFKGVRNRLGEYSQRWISRTRSPDPDSLNTGRGIIKAWHDAWQPYADAMERFQCTKPARAMASRIASFNTRPGSRPSSRPSSRGASPRPGLNHSASFASKSSTKEGSTRARSTSLLGPTVPPSPTKESRFNLLRVGSKNIKSAQPSPKTSRPTSLHIPGSDGRSFGLPKIPDHGLDGQGKLGTSPIFNRPSPTISRSNSARQVNEPVQRMERRPSEFGVGGRDNAGLGFGDVRRSREERSFERLNEHVEGDRSSRSFPPPAFVPPKTVSYEIDAAEGWRGEPVLYRCACVADFDPFAIGNKRYRGLRFLSMNPGDLFDVFHEVGRIDELPKFPYPEVGVDNDGVLVGRGESGAIGLLICSFLEPLKG